MLQKFPDVSGKLRYFKFPGQGQRLTPVAPVPVLVEIAWLLPGKQAAEFRRQGARTLCRALGGDLSLVEEIKARHAEVANTHEQAAFLGGTGVSVAEANCQALAIVPSKGLALDEEERCAKLQKLDLDNLRTALELSASIYEVAGRETDDRQRVWLHDQSKNLL